MEIVLDLLHFHIGCERSVRDEEDVVVPQPRLILRKHDLIEAIKDPGLINESSREFTGCVPLCTEVFSIGPLPPFLTHRQCGEALLGCAVACVKGGMRSDHTDLDLVFIIV